MPTCKRFNMSLIPFVLPSPTSGLQSLLFILLLILDNRIILQSTTYFRYLRIIFYSPTQHYPSHWIRDKILPVLSFKCLWDPFVLSVPLPQLSFLSLVSAIIISFYTHFSASILCYLITYYILPYYIVKNLTIWWERSDMHIIKIRE